MSVRFFLVIPISEMSGIIRSIWRTSKPFCELTETEMTEISQKSVVTMLFCILSNKRT